MRILPILLAVLVLVGSFGRAAAADEVSRDTEIEELFKQGIALRRSGNDEAALAVFLDIEKMSPESVRVLLHISTAAQATGKWVMAYDYLQKAAAHREDPYYIRHKAAIDNVEATIAQRVGQFRVRGSPAGAEVRLSGQIIGTLPMIGVRPVEVGSYVLEVSKPGYYSLRRPITIVPGAGLTQEAVELREQTPPTIFPVASTELQQQPTATPAPVPADTGVTTPQSWWRARWVTWTLAGVGVAAAATTGVAWGIRERDAARWNDSNQCLRPQNAGLSRGAVCPGLQDNIKAAEDVAIAGGIATVFFGGAALIHGLVTAHDHSEPAPRPQTSTTCTPGLGSLVCEGTF